METIYKHEYFYDNMLIIPPYELYRNSIRLIESKEDGEEKQHLINQLCDFVGMMDFAPLVKECEKEMKDKGMISKSVTIESFTDDEVVDYFDYSDEVEEEV